MTASGSGSDIGAKNAALEGRRPPQSFEEARDLHGAELERRLRVAVEERPLALRRIGREDPAVSFVARDDVKVEVEDRLEGDLAVTEQDIDSLTAQP